jgi:hypothetical protein
MKTSVQTFVSACTVCSQAKPDQAKYPGLLQPVQIPSSAWQIISVDFIEGLPSSGRFNAILVVVDKLTMYGHFLAHVYKLHGLPQSIISDRDRIFLSRLWRELFTLADVQLCMSSAYHPQSDSQNERVNQCLQTFLRCFIHACPS